MAKQPLLTEQELQEALSSAEGWRLEGEKWLVKSYLHPTFPEAVDFVNRVAEAAEEEEHHPFIAIEYRRVQLKLTTWHSGGLTQLDLIMARRCDTLFIK
ncbi:4a-hydroxytetrahydrobiopterin dehydratase [Paenibacillus radicis (ex Gao et al. 2016)]|uniref:4a-hydroxytetrahydrobiopterin dehydratase n=1 Tax=Paenibacillus radicis (ex Gao et al. 2016) TaxID=1737354 RepID=A0A917M4T8_9BACL|nr:4a-hydroxytetrahydrobiopterin dehydratase [Paenibacillus radicis (ex Gao et al. 2016)]GGG77913.1 4a-hydroxytetrahydrobiopterin dehydratase [Paenibacillus radicis (ex Gao et al. 2016)]